MTLFHIKKIGKEHKSAALQASDSNLFGDVEIKEPRYRVNAEIVASRSNLFGNAEIKKII